MPGIFLGEKFKAHAFLGVRNMKVRWSPPPSCILLSTSLSTLMSTAEYICLTQTPSPPG